MIARSSTRYYWAAICLVAASLGGCSFWHVFGSSDWKASGSCQDLFDLVFAVPALLLSACFITRGRAQHFSSLRNARILMYTFIIYTVGVHFNRFFFFSTALHSHSHRMRWSTVMANKYEEVKGWSLLLKRLYRLYLLFSHSFLVLLAKRHYSCHA